MAKKQGGVPPGEKKRTFRLRPRGKKPPAARGKGLFARFFASVGNMLYTLGFGAEYMTVRAWRRLRDTARMVAQLAVWFAGRAAGRIVLAARDIWRDLTAPLARYRKRRAQMQRLHERRRRRAAAGEKQRGLTGVRVKISLQLLAAVLAFLMPVAASGVLIYTVYNVLSMDYALAVEHNGHLLGYVADQTVVDSATGLLRQRIRLAEGQEMRDWQLTPTYTIARTSRFTTTRELVNEILLSGVQPGDAVEATGLYVNRELVGVVREGQLLREYLDGLLAARYDAEYPDAVVDFVDEVVCEPDNGDVYFLSSLMEYDELIEKISQNKEDEGYYIADGETSLADIAHESDITFEQLIARNPDYEGMRETSRPEAGTRLLVHRARPYLPVSNIVRRQSEEPIPYKVIEQENSEAPAGSSRIVQQGTEGLQEVWDDYYYVDGELESRQRIDALTVILQEPVDQIIQIGTRPVASGLPGSIVGGGSYVFPVPDSGYSSRGYTPGGHRGLDINAAAGAGIYACEGGTVTTAGWHWSWGNYIVIDHGNGVTTLYAHCSALYVAAGDGVGRGALIGAVGSTGVSSGNHCHLEFSVNGELVDPVPYVGYPY